MKHDTYHTEASPSLFEFEFYSEGPKGRTKKKIAFKAFRDNPNVFNLTFGDVDENGNVNDKVVTNNRDSQKVLARVAMAIFMFCEKYPDYYLSITGSTKSRTRLYRICISNNLAEIRHNLDVFGFIEESWETFVKGREYEVFLIKKKS